MEMIPRVIQTVAGPNYTVYAYFHDGTVRLFDTNPMLEKGGVFLPLRDNAVTDKKAERLWGNAKLPHNPSHNLQTNFS